MAVGDLFSFNELKELSKNQLLRVCAYLEIETSKYDKNSKLIEKILDFQNPKVVLQSGEVVRKYNSNGELRQSDLNMSVRIRRLLELNRKKE